MKKLAPVLLAEEDLNFTLMMWRAFERAGAPHLLNAVPNGKEALDYLSGAGPYADRARFPMPGLLLLNSQLPLINASDVLAWLTPRIRFDDLTVIVLTSQDNPIGNVRASGEDGRASCIKPSNLSDLVNLVDAWSSLWPTNSAPAKTELSLPSIIGLP